MPRTSPTLVQQILGYNWDGVADLTPYIATANNIINRTVQLAATSDPTDPMTPITDNGVGSEAELMERWVAAYYYTKMDPLYMSRSTLGASGQFGRAMEGKDYLESAIQMDPSGYLGALINKTLIGADWGGKPLSQQIPYWDRN